MRIDSRVSPSVLLSGNERLGAAIAVHLWFHGECIQAAADDRAWSLHMTLHTMVQEILAEERAL